MERIEELKQSAFTPVRCQGCDDGFGNIACTNPACAHPKACEMATGLSATERRSQLGSEPELSARREG